MQTISNWATVENFSAFIAGMNGGKDGGTHGRLPGFAVYVERDGSIVCEDEEEQEEEDDRDDEALQDDFDCANIDGVPLGAKIAGEIVYTDAEIDLLLALTACPSCGEIPDRLDRCGCLY